MSGNNLGLKECISMALGGMIGGGIFAVLGVVAQIVYGATWFSFVLAGIVALCAGYSYNKLNSISDDKGGSVTFIQCFTGKTKLAGMAGWTLLFGYIGSMAMYAYAFGSFTVGFNIIPDTLFGLPLRPAISILVIAGFAGLNLLGAKSTGTAENIMVAIKVLILLAFGVGGIWYGFAHEKLVFGFSQLISFNPIMAAAISFVAFQGWQLLFYDQAGISNPVSTIRKAIYIAIPSAVVLYVIVAITTVSLAPMEVIRQHPERALAVAADPFIPYGFTIISLAALFSTGSAINATLFSSGYFAKGMLSKDLLPDAVGKSSTDGLPQRTVITLAVITAAFAAYGSLNAITSFASLAFIIVFGGISCIAFMQRDHDSVNSFIPAAGTLGAIGFFFLMFWHLYQSEPGTFYSVLIIAAGIVSAELLYFERNELKSAITSVEELLNETDHDTRQKS